jgi:hypothetical protein
LSFFDVFEINGDIYLIVSTSFPFFELFAIIYEKMEICCFFVYEIIPLLDEIISLNNEIGGKRMSEDIPDQSDDLIEIKK